MSENRRTGKVLEPPSHWKELDPSTFPAQLRGMWRAWDHSLTDMRVLRSLSTVKNGENWIHVSISRQDRLPTWQEIAKVRDEFLGDDVEAYHVAPMRKDYVNVHAHCLHLWVPCDGVRRVANLMDLTNEVPA